MFTIAGVVCRVYVANPLGQGSSKYMHHPLSVYKNMCLDNFVRERGERGTGVNCFKIRSVRCMDTAALPASVSRVFRNKVK